jgi:hypothetical protein
MSENKDDESGASQLSSSPNVKRIGAYDSLSRGLTMEELSQSGTQKLILNDLTRAEARVERLEYFEKEYYELKIVHTKLVEQASKKVTSEILYSFSVTIGGVIIGLSKIFYDSSLALCLFMVCVGALLIGSGIFFKFKTNSK